MDYLEMTPGIVIQLNLPKSPRADCFFPVITLR